MGKDNTTSAAEILGYQQKSRNALSISSEVMKLCDERKELKKIKDSSKENRRKYNRSTKEIEES